MIWYYLILFVTSLLTVVFSWLPKITALPIILDVNTDTSLTLAMGYFYGFVGTFWPIAHIFIGGLFLLAYLFVKNIILKFSLGHRAPH